MIPRKPLVVRTRNGAYVDGRWFVSGYTDSEILASVQAVTPDDMKAIPEGRRLSKSFAIITDSKLDMVRPGVANPSIVVVDGVEYEVVSESVWSNGILPHNRYVIVGVIES